MTVYPVVPGHEIIGKISKLGKGVQNFKENDIVGVGCLIDSCQTCYICRNNEEQFCNEKFLLMTPKINTRVEEPMEDIRSK
jgi:uncharacterized zinc-type alcohol dehydrogenase-like protein